MTYRSTLLNTHLPLNTAARKINRSFEHDLANSPNPTPSLLIIPNHPFTFLPSAKKKWMEKIQIALDKKLRKVWTFLDKFTKFTKTFT